MADGLEIAGGVGVAGLGAAALRLAQWWFEQRAKRPAKPSVQKDAADLVSAAAVFQEHLNVAAEGIVRQLRGEIGRLEAEVENLRRKHEACEADARRIEGDLNNQRQVTESLARELRRAGIDVTDLTGQRPLIMLQASLPEETK
jgi:outer membrane murein-binding lipoprotein Lpp